MVRILNTVICRSHRFKFVLKIKPEFMKVEFTETDPYLGKMVKTYRVINTNDRFSRGGGAIIDKRIFLKILTEGASLISGSSLFHSERQFG